MTAQELPNIDGYVLTMPPLEYISKHANVPVMVGSNMYEMMLFAFRPGSEQVFNWDMDEQGLALLAEDIINSLAYRQFTTANQPPTFATAEMVNNLLALYPASSYTAYAAGVEPLFADMLCHTPWPLPLPCNFTTSAARAVAMVTDLFFTLTAETIATAVASSGQGAARAYRYLFQQNMTGGITWPNGTPMNLWGTAGAFHSLDIPFVFDSFSEYGAAFGLVWTPTATQRNLSARMQNAWINFAVRGSPNGGTTSASSNSVTWPAWTQTDDAASTVGQ